MTPVSKRSIDRELDKLERDIERGIRNGMDHVVLPNGIKAGQDQIRAFDRIWHREVLNSFKKAKMSDDPLVYHIWNWADHADTVNDGRRPGAPPPPTYALVPWVVDHAAVLGINPADPEEVVDVADAIAFNISRKGQEPVNFMGAIERYLESKGEDDLEDYFNIR